MARHTPLRTRGEPKITQMEKPASSEAALRTRVAKLEKQIADLAAQKTKPGKTPALPADALDLVAAERRKREEIKRR